MKKTTISQLTGKHYDIDSMTFSELKKVLEEEFPTTDVVVKYLPVIIKRTGDEGMSNSQDIFKLIMLLQYAIMMIDDLINEKDTGKGLTNSNRGNWLRK